MRGITTHVLDTSRGRPAAGMRITLEIQTAGDGWVPVGDGVTDDDGRVPGLAGDGAPAKGVHRMTFFTGEWFEAEGIEGFYPLVTIECLIDDPLAHYHIPLLISPYGYSTYRGS